MLAAGWIQLVVSATIAGASPLGPSVDPLTLQLPPRPPGTPISLGLSGFHDIEAGGGWQLGLRSGLQLERPFWVGLGARIDLPERTGALDDPPGSSWALRTASLLAAGEGCLRATVLACIEVAAGPELVVGSARGAQVFSARSSARWGLRTELTARLRLPLGRIEPWIAVGGYARPARPGFSIVDGDPFEPDLVGLRLGLGLDVWWVARRPEENE